MTVDEKVRELVAVGASIAANCRPCLRYHAKKALESGADAEDIAAAVEVGRQVRRGAAAQMDEFSATLRDGGDSTKRSARTACCG